MRLTRQYLIVILLVISVFISACTESVNVTINFDSNGGSFVSTISTDGRSSITIPSDPEKEGYSFGGWYWDNETFNDPFTTNSLLNRPVSSSLTVYAKWIINQYTISFESNGGNVISSITQYFDTAINQPNNPIKTGHSFFEWHSNAELTSPYQFTQIQAENIRLYAKWTIKQYTISFNSNSGSLVSSITQDYSTTVIEPESPERLGYTFAGWFSDIHLTIPYVFDKIDAQDMTLYAKWQPILYTIIYELNGGMNNSSNPTEYNIITESIILDEPTKESYTFDGWFKNAEISSELVAKIAKGSTGNIVFYAKWTINQYTINYGLITENYDSSQLISLYPGEKIINFSAGAYHSSALTSKGRVFTWGYNNYGQLGNFITTTKTSPEEITHRFKLFESEIVISLSMGFEHSSALTSKSRIFTWGSTANGRLGDGVRTGYNLNPNPVDITTQFELDSGETFISLSLGGQHSSVLTSKGRTFTWGANSNGQLGDGTTTQRNSPTEITSHFNLDVGEKITILILGKVHSSALTSEGRLFMWGANSDGQLGDGTKIDKTKPMEITSHFNLGEGEKIISQSLGVKNSSALTSEGRIFTWGSNWSGQSGDGTTTDKTTPTDITSHFNLDVGEKITTTTLSWSHSSALTSKDRVFTWGSNFAGQLGDGTEINRLIPLEITSNFDLDESEKVISLYLGFASSFVLTSKNRIFTWGYNDYGQLGDGTTINKSKPALLPIYSPVLIHTDTYDYNQIIIEHLPKLEGFTFSGWYIDIDMTTLYTFSIMPPKNVYLYGYWIAD